MRLRAILTYSLVIYCYSGVMTETASVGKTTRSKKLGQAFNGMVNVIGSITEVRDIYSGRSTLSDLSWLQVNKIVVKVLGELDNMWVELEQTQKNGDLFNKLYHCYVLTWGRLLYGFGAGLPALCKT